MYPYDSEAHCFHRAVSLRHLFGWVPGCFVRWRTISLELPFMQQRSEASLITRADCIVSWGGLRLGFHGFCPVPWQLCVSPAGRPAPGEREDGWAGQGRITTPGGAESMHPAMAGQTCVLHPPPPRPWGLVDDSVWLQVKLRFEKAGRRGLGWPRFVDSVLLRNPLAARRFRGVSAILVRPLRRCV